MFQSYTYLNNIILITKNHFCELHSMEESLFRKLNVYIFMFTTPSSNMHAPTFDASFGVLCKYFTMFTKYFFVILNIKMKNAISSIIYAMPDNEETLSGAPKIN